MFETSINKKKKCSCNKEQLAKQYEQLIEKEGIMKMDTEEMERDIQAAINNNYQIIYSPACEFDMILLHSKRLLFYNKNGQLMVNSTIKKVKNVRETDGRTRIHNCSGCSKLRKIKKSKTH